MTPLDGLQRRSAQRRRLSEGQRNEPRLTPPTTARPRRGSGVLLILLAFTILAFLLVRPNPSPEVTNDTAQAEQSDDPVVEERAPSTDFSPPRTPLGTTLDDLTILDQPTARSTPQPDTSTTPADRAPTTEFTVRILNGGGKAGAASQLKTDLETSGYTVSSIGNARTTYDTTTVYYRGSVAEDATALAQALGEPQPTIEESEVAAPADILIVIGQDRQ